MTLDFDAQVNGRGFDLAFGVKTGETIAVMGPNGAGKSTLLGLLAGLVHADQGHARLDDRTLFDATAGSRAWTQPHRRGVALLAQEALLFPHLSVLDNVAFGPRSTGASRQEARAVARQWLTDVDAAELGGRRPAALSGGQAQRVGVARALAADPSLLLLDEPLSALDIGAAPALRRLLTRVLADRTALLVTHDPLDALVLADRVLVIESGRLVDDGPTREVFAHPRTAFVAGLAGLNLVTGVRSAGGIEAAAGWEVVAPFEAEVARGASSAVVVKPASVRVSHLEPGRAEGNAVRQTILDVEPRGDSIRIRGDMLAADVTPAAAADLDLAPGDTAWFAFSADAGVGYAL